MKTVALTPKSPTGPGGAAVNRDWSPSGNPRQIVQKKARTLDAGAAALVPIPAGPARHRQVQDLRVKLQRIQQAQSTVLSQAEKALEPSRVKLQTVRDARGNLLSTAWTAPRPSSAKLRVSRYDDSASVSALGNDAGEHLSSRVPLGRQPRRRSDAVRISGSSRAPGPWVPAGAMLQPPQTVSWHRPAPSAPRDQAPSNHPMLRMRPASPAPSLRDSEVLATRPGQDYITPPTKSSQSWRVEEGEGNVSMLNPDGKLRLAGAAHISYQPALASGHLIRFLFNARPPASALGAQVSVSSSCDGPVLL